VPLIVLCYTSRLDRCTTNLFISSLFSLVFIEIHYLWMDYYEISGIASWAQSRELMEQLAPRHQNAKAPRSVLVGS
jgi:hypothetical protein